MSDIKRLPERLDCMLFRTRFQEELSELTPVSAPVMWCACDVHDIHVTSLHVMCILHWLSCDMRVTSLVLCIHFTGCVVHTLHWLCHVVL